MVGILADDADPMVSVMKVSAHVSIDMSDMPPEELGSSS